MKKRVKKKVQVDNDDIEILTDGNGRRYSFNNTTDEAKWLDEESVDETYRNPMKKRVKKKVQVDNDDIEILTDGNGRRYSFNNTTDEAKWLDEESVDETQAEETEWLGVYPNENIDDVDVVKLETLEDDNGRRYSWNPTTDETS